MISRADVDRLLAREPTPASPVLSVYLDVDQSRATNLNREFEAVLKKGIRTVEQQLDDARRDAFAADARRVMRFVGEYQAHARTLVVFADDSAGFFWHGELRASLPSDVRWEPRPWVRPLVELLDENPRYGVVLVDKERARVFTVFLGEIEEEREALAAAEVRHKKSSGTDHWRSQMHFQRRDDMHVQWHLKRVAELMEDVARPSAFDRLVLAGPVEATSELHRLLPKALRERVVGTLRRPFEAPASDVLQETLRLAEEAGREQDDARVTELLEAVGRAAVVGLDATLAALNERRAHVLLHADGYASRGGECPSCRALFASGPRCDYCGTSLQPIEDLLTRAIERIHELGGRAEKVRGEAASRLLDAGGIGCLLRF